MNTEHSTGHGRLKMCDWKGMDYNKLNKVNAEQRDN